MDIVKSISVCKAHLIWISSSVCVCVRACVRACLPACGRACVCVVVDAVFKRIF